MKIENLLTQATQIANKAAEIAPSGLICLAYQCSMVNGQWSTANEWYDLRGHKLNGVPNRPGIYIHDGKKYLLK